jgi:hypothetical protein
MRAVLKDKNELLSIYLGVCCTVALERLQCGEGNDREPRAMMLWMVPG